MAVSFNALLFLAMLFLSMLFLSMLIETKTVSHLLFFLSMAIRTRVEIVAKKHQRVSSTLALLYVNIYIRYPCAIVVVKSHWPGSSKSGPSLSVPGPKNLQTKSPAGPA